MGLYTVVQINFNSIQKTQCVITFTICSYANDLYLPMITSTELCVTLMDVGQAVAITFVCSAWSVSQSNRFE